MLITVTKSDIEQGGHTCQGCPVAMGIMRTTCAEYVSVCPPSNSHLIQIDGLIYHAPPLVLDFVDHFDAGEPVKPFLFNLTEPVTQ